MRHPIVIDQALASDVIELRTSDNVAYDRMSVSEPNETLIAKLARVRQGSVIAVGSCLQPSTR